MAKISRKILFVALFSNFVFASVSWSATEPAVKLARRAICDQTLASARSTKNVEINLGSTHQEQLDIFEAVGAIKRKLTPAQSETKKNLEFLTEELSRVYQCNSRGLPYTIEDSAKQAGFNQLCLVTKDGIRVTSSENLKQLSKSLKELSEQKSISFTFGLDLLGKFGIATLMSSSPTKILDQDSDQYAFEQAAKLWIPRLTTVAVEQMALIESNCSVRIVEQVKARLEQWSKTPNGIWLKNHNQNQRSRSRPGAR